VISILKESRKQELEEDTTILQALETYIPLQANNYLYTDSDDNEKNDSYDCHQHIVNLKKKHDRQKQQVIVLQGKSGSGKSIFCRHLEEVLWELYANNSLISIPVYISLPKCYNELNEKTKSQVYKAFNKQWIDIHVKNISNKLSELRIQSNPKKIKFAFQQYCQDLGFEMFIQENQVATENDYKEYEIDNIWSKLDPIIETETKSEDEKLEIKKTESNTTVTKNKIFGINISMVTVLQNIY
ncbi:hypothetical protein RFI_31152, partial [Reticulomyxa filosa]